jgi:hypothetical protein
VILEQSARNLIGLARAGEPAALQAIREIADRLDRRSPGWQAEAGRAEVTLRQALASELTDDDLAAIASGAKDEEIEPNPRPDSSKLN